MCERRISELKQCMRNWVEKWVEDIMHFPIFFPWTLILLGGPGGKIELDVSFLTEHGRKDGSAHEQEQEQGRGIGGMSVCTLV